MEQEKENFKTIATLVKESLSLDAIVHLILDNAEINDISKELRITNQPTIMQFIKYLYPEEYNNKLRELKTKE